MAASTTQSFFDTLAKSDLLTAQQLADARQESGEAEDPKAAARGLLKSGLLTKWQAERVLRGQHNLKLGKYTLLEQLGSEEVGIVYLAEHVQMGRRVIIKTLSNKHTNNPQAVQRFLSQAQRIAALHHRNIIHLFDVSSEGDRYYIVLENAEGKDLGSLVAADGPLGRETAAEYLLQTAEGLGHAHGKGLFHGDLKPENLLVDDQGTVKIVNFGVATLVEHEGQPIDAASDLSALGNIGTFLLTGKTGLGERTSAPPGIESICLKLANKNPAEAFTSADEAAAAIKKWLSEQRAAGASSAPKIQRTAAPAAHEKEPPVPRPKPPGLVKRAAKMEEPADDGFHIAVDTSVQNDGSTGDFPQINIQTTKLAVKPAAPKASKPAKQAPQPSDSTAAPSPAEKKPIPPLLFVAGGAGAGVLAMLLVGLVLFFLWPRSAKEQQVASGDKGAGKKAQAVDPEKDDEKPVDTTTKSPNPDPAKPADPPTPSEVAKPPTPAPEPPTPDVPAVSNPIPAPTPPTPAPTPAPQPPMPAPLPAPVPMPVPPGQNPFRELAQVVELPELGTAEKPAEKATEPFTLGALHAQPKELILFDLVGGEKAVKGKQSFSLKAASGGTSESEWEISLNPSGEAGPSSPVIATLAAKEGRLEFQWTNKALADPLANHLRNCVFSARTGAFNHALALRKPTDAPPITVALERAMKANVAIDFSPNPEAIEVEITSLEGEFPKNKIEPKSFGALKGNGQILIGSDMDPTMILKVNAVTSKSVQIMVAPFFKLALWPKEERYTKALVTKAFNEVSTTQRNLFTLVDQMNKVTDATQKTELAPTKALREQDLAKCVAALSQFDELKEINQKINNSGKIHYRIYYVAGDQQVELARTPGPAAKPAADPAVPPPAGADPAAAAK